MGIGKAFELRQCGRDYLSRTRAGGTTHVRWRVQVVVDIVKAIDLKFDVDLERFSMECQRGQVAKRVGVGVGVGV